MSTIYVSKSGLDTNSGASYLLSKLTISAGITAAGAGGTTIVGSGLYNEKPNLSTYYNNPGYIYCDGTVVVDGTGIPNNNPALNASSIIGVTIAPYIYGGQMIVQNHIATNLCYMNYGCTFNFTNVIFLSNNNTNCFSMNSASNALTLTNTIISGFTNIISGTGLGAGNVFSIYNSTLYNGTIGFLFNSSNPNIIISGCIFSNFTTAWNIVPPATIQYLNDNLYYNITNWVISGSTYTSLAQVQALNVNYDSRSIVTDPHFVDASNNIFYLTQQTPLFPNAKPGAYPYSYTRGNANNPDNTWNIITLPLNTGWYNPDGNITKNGTTGYFELTGGTSGIIFSPIIDSGVVSNKTTRLDIAADQYWPTNMIDTTISDIRPNYQTVEIRASDSLFAQNDGGLAWNEVKANITFTAISGRYVQIRLTFRSNDVAA